MRKWRVNSAYYGFRSMRGDYIKKECLAESIEFDEELVERDFDLIRELKVGSGVVRSRIKNV